MTFSPFFSGSPFCKWSLPGFLKGRSDRLWLVKFLNCSPLDSPMLLSSPVCLTTTAPFFIIVAFLSNKPCGLFSHCLKLPTKTVYAFFFLSVGHLFSPTVKLDDLYVFFSPPYWRTYVCGPSVLIPSSLHIFSYPFPFCRLFSSSDNSNCNFGGRGSTFCFFSLNLLLLVGKPVFPHNLLLHCFFFIILSFFSPADWWNHQPAIAFPRAFPSCFIR